MPGLDRLDVCTHDCAAAAASAFVVLHSNAEGGSRRHHTWLRRHRLADGWRERGGGIFAARFCHARAHPSIGGGLALRGFLRGPIDIFNQILRCRETPATALCIHPPGSRSLLVPAIYQSRHSRAALRNPASKLLRHHAQTMITSRAAAKLERRWKRGASNVSTGLRRQPRGELVTSHAARSSALCRELLALSVPCSLCETFGSDCGALRRQITRAAAAEGSLCR